MNRQLLLARLHGRAFAVDIGAAVVLAVLCLIPSPWGLAEPSLITAFLAVVAVAFRRVTPGGALVVAWLMAIVAIGLNERPSAAALAFLLVVYVGASMGNRGEMIASAVSAFVGGIVATLYLGETGARYLRLLYEGTTEQRLIAVVAPIGVLASAWLAGLAVKFFRSQQTESERRQEAEGETVRALDVAQAERLRTTMARDVHDIVGHSLAVIIAQADSVEFLDDTDRIRAVSATIADTARRSLQEVRAVLSGTTDDVLDDGHDLESIVDQIRAAGVVVDRTVRGEPRPLDTATGVVVRRVLQEMLTNALRHGLPGQPILLREAWRSEDLVLEVENAMADVPNPGTQVGIDGMRSRVTAVGGFLEAEGLDGVFTARARIPVAASSPVRPAAAPSVAPSTPVAPSPTIS